MFYFKTPWCNSAASVNQDAEQKVEPSPIVNEIGISARQNSAELDAIGNKHTAESSCFVDEQKNGHHIAETVINCGNNIGLDRKVDVVFDLAASASCEEVSKKAISEGSIHVVIPVARPPNSSSSTLTHQRNELTASCDGNGDAAHDEVPSSTNAVNGGTVSLLGTVFCLMCQLLGMGCQQLPWAMSIGGWIGFAWLGLVACMSCYTAAILGSVSELPLDYPKIIAIGLGEKGRILSSISQCTTLTAVASIFLILAGTNLQEVLPVLNVREWIIVVAVVMFPLCCLRDLRFLQPSTMLGICGAVVTAAFCIAAAFRSEAPGFSSNIPAISPDGFPVAAASFVLAFGCHAALPYVRNSMQDRSQYLKALVIAWSLVLCVEYGLVWGALYAFGDDQNSPVLLSLPAGPIRRTCLVLVTLNCCAVLPFLVGALAAKFNYVLGPERKDKFKFRAGVRFCLVCSYVVIGASLPYFRELVPIQGALNGTATIYIFPSLLQLSLRWKTMRWWERIWCLFILVAAVFISFGLGLFFSIWRLVDRVAAG